MAKKFGKFLLFASAAAAAGVAAYRYAQKNNLLPAKAGADEEEFSPEEEACETACEEPCEEEFNEEVLEEEAALDPVETEEAPAMETEEFFSEN